MFLACPRDNQYDMNMDLVRLAEAFTIVGYKEGRIDGMEEHEWVADLNPTKVEVTTKQGASSRTDTLRHTRHAASASAPVARTLQGVLHAPSPPLSFANLMPPWAKSDFLGPNPHFFFSRGFDTEERRLPEEHTGVPTAAAEPLHHALQPPKGLEEQLGELQSPRELRDAQRKLGTAKEGLALRLWRVVSRQGVRHKKDWLPAPGARRQVFLSWQGW